MGIVKQAADLVYTYRFIRAMVQSFESTDAFKLGIIDADGKRTKEPLDTSEKKDAYTPFVRLVFNIKRLINKVPFGSSKIGSLAAALLLIKESNNLSDKNLEKILEAANLETLDFLKEQNEWFVTNDKMLSPGVYRINTEKMLNRTFEERVKPKDLVRVLENCYPIGNVFGIDIYKAIHTPTNQEIYISSSEIYK